MDVFAWGNSKGDGLFLLVIPLWVFPLLSLVVFFLPVVGVVTEPCGGVIV